MKRLIESNPWWAGMPLAALFLFSLSLQPANAYALGKVTFKNYAPFAGVYGPSTLTATNTDSLLTVSTWADANATVPVSMYQRSCLLRIDSGVGNGALLDG